MMLRPRRYHDGFGIRLDRKYPKYGTNPPKIDMNSPCIRSFCVGSHSSRCAVVEYIVLLLSGE